MAQLYASVAAGTIATLLAIVLILLRSEFHGRRLVVALTQRWVATTRRTSAQVLGLFFAIAASCFASIADNEWGHSDSASSRSGFALQTTDPDDRLDADQSLDALRAYAAQIDDKPTSIAAASSEANSDTLPDVNTMIAKLISRLEKQPNDVNGWKMLGWSYLNTGRPDEAAQAYQSALNIEPGNVEIEKGLQAAKSARAAGTRIPPPNPSSEPTSDNIKSAGSAAGILRDGMIHDMVDRLAARLETSPNDEIGWLRLMSSRVTLDERDAAKTALIKGLAAFATDAAARTRLIAAARELGLKPDKAF